MNICLRCGKDFSRQDSFRRHLRNKKQCESIFLDISPESMIKDYKKLYPMYENEISQKKSYLSQTSMPEVCEPTILVCEKYAKNNVDHKKTICEHCGRSFGYKNNYYAHKKKNCKVLKKERELQMIIEELNLLKGKILEENLEKEEMKTQINELELKLLQVSTVNTINNSHNNTNTHNNNSHNNNNTNNVQININNYGNEDLSHLTTKDWETIIAKEFDMLPSFVETVHIDNEENRNIYVPGIKDAIVLVKKDDKWMRLEKHSFITDMLIEKRLQLQEAINAHGDDFTNVNKNRAQAVFDYVNNDEDELKRIKNKTTLLLINNKDEIKDTYEKNYGKKIII